MKVKDKNPRRSMVFSVTVPADLVPEIERRAAEQELTVSAYFRRLIKTDLKTIGNPESVDIIQ
jgi:hypothetical protein